MVDVAYYTFFHILSTAIRKLDFLALNWQNQAMQPLKPSTTPKTTAELKKAMEQLYQTESTREEKPFRYILYVRKSTDEKDKQLRSLGDQIIECRKFSESLGLKIVRIMKESESAKEPDIRPRFREMLELIKNDKADGIIAWHPDRLSRNMKEGGEIIDLIDKSIIRDLKFPSFTFENTTSGKMSLGITFVLSKQYSDQLSDAVRRGNRNSIQEGKWLTTAKHGYVKDKNQILRPDVGGSRNNFQLIKDAFKMKRQGKTLQEIAEYLNKNGYSRQQRKNRKKFEVFKMTVKDLSELLRDPIYVGVMMYGEELVDLTEVYNFIPMLEVEEFCTMNRIDKISKAFKATEKGISKGIKKAVLMNNIVICAYCDSKMNPAITPKAMKSGEKKQYYNFRCNTPGCKNQNKSIRAKIILDFAVRLLREQPFSSSDAYKGYVKEMQALWKKRLEQQVKQVGHLGAVVREAKRKRDETLELLRGEIDMEIQVVLKQEIKALTKDLKQYTAELKSLQTQLEQKNPDIVDSKRFFELFKILPSFIGKIESMEDLDWIMRKIFVNFTIKNKKVASYSLNAPFNGLVKAPKTTKFTSGAGNEI